MVVFTKYDTLLVPKEDELGDIQDIEGAKEVHDTCVQSLKNIVSTDTRTTSCEGFGYNFSFFI